MCNSIVFTDGTEIEQFPEKIGLSCLCRFPEKIIKQWLDVTYPNKKFRKTTFGWEEK